MHKHIAHCGLRVQLVVWECNCQLQIPVSCLPFSSIFTGIELLEARLDNLGDALPNPGVNRRMELVNHQLPEKVQSEDAIILLSPQQQLFQKQI